MFTVVRSPSCIFSCLYFHIKRSVRCLSGAISVDISRSFSNFVFLNLAICCRKQQKRRCGPKMSSGYVKLGRFYAKWLRNHYYFSHCLCLSSANFFLIISRYTKNCCMKASSLKYQQLAVLFL